MRITFLLKFNIEPKVFIIGIFFNYFTKKKIVYKKKPAAVIEIKFNKLVLQINSHSILIENINLYSRDPICNKTLANISQLLSTTCLKYC